MPRGHLATAIVHALARTSAVIDDLRLVSHAALVPVTASRTSSMWATRGILPGQPQAQHGRRLLVQRLGFPAVGGHYEDEVVGISKLPDYAAWKVNVLARVVSWCGRVIKRPGVRAGRSYGSRLRRTGRRGCACSPDVGVAGVAVASTAAAGCRHCCKASRSVSARASARSARRPSASARSSAFAASRAATLAGRLTEPGQRVTGLRTWTQDVVYQPVSSRSWRRSCGCSVMQVIRSGGIGCMQV
jgi:hypothetical protein